MKTDDIKREAMGKWPEILRRLAPELSPALDSTKHVNCPLPGHRDEHPSFRFSDASAGKAACTCGTYDAFDLLKELRGWDFSEACQQVAEELGETSKHKVNGNHKKKANTPPKAYESADAAIAAANRSVLAQESSASLTNRWEYYSGATLAGVVGRWDFPGGKTIRPVSLHGDRWRTAAMAEPRPLYRLDKIASADPVHIFEGEKCADAAASVGLTATTWAGGANAWRQTDWSPLADKDVFIWPDNDPHGHKCADDLAEYLRDNHGCHAVVVRLPGVSAGGDVADWLDERDATEPADLRAQLERMAADADPVPQVMSVGHLVRNFTQLRPILDFARNVLSSCGGCQ